MKNVTKLADVVSQQLGGGDVNIPRIDANAIVPNVLNTIYMWAGIVAVLVIIIAGFMYVTSAGNAATVKKAKDAILGAVIGLVVVIMAFAITTFVLGRF